MALEKQTRGQRDRILIAEDSLTQIEHLRSLLEERGYIVDAAENGRLALEIAKARPPQLVISDVNMPEMDGYEFCGHFKADAALKDIPFMLVTSLTAPADVVRGLECGADNFISKPYEENNLLERVRYLLTNNALRGNSKVRSGIELELGGKVHFITAERHQILDLLISTYAEAVRLSEEAVRRGEQLRESYEIMSVLQKSAEGLNKVRTEDEVVMEALARVRDLPFCRAAWVLLTDDDGMVARAAEAGLAEDEVQALSARAICSCQRDSHLGKLEPAAQIEDCSRMRGLGGSSGAVAHASVPLRGQQRNFGILNAYPRDPRPFSAQELHILSGLGSQITAALDRAFLNTNLERKVAARTQDLRREVAVRQAAESTAIAATARLERAQRIAHVGSADVSLTTGQTFWSDEMYRLLGIAPRSAPPGVKTFGAAVHPEDHAKWDDISARSFAGQAVEPIELRILRADGQVRWLLRHSERVAGQDGETVGLAVTLQDITDLKSAQDSLREYREHLELAQRVGEIGSAEIDLVTGLEVWSDEHCRLFGVPPDAAPRRADYFMSFVHPDDRHKIVAANERSVRGEEDQDVEFRIIRPDGTERQFVARHHTLRNQRGNAIKLLVTNQDVTAARKAETERKGLEAQLVQSQKMEAVGNLTGGIAHDFNNILAVVIGNLDLLKLELPDEGEVAELIDTAVGACLKGSELTKSLLAFSRRQPLQPKRININKLLQEGTKMLSRAIGESVQVHLKLADALWDTVIDPSLLESALLNMMVNSRDAMPDGGHIVIESRNTWLDESYAAQNAEVVPGEYVVLEVSDTGTGMPPEVLQRVFEPFFTTKEKGKGTGLGLAMVFGFVKQSGGHIKIYSEVGHGTTIRVYLPRAGAEMDTVQNETPSVAPIKTGNEMVLVVEDNPSVRRGVCKQLKGAGYRIEEADTATKALELLEGGLVPDLVFSDVIMPGGMTGADLARTVAKRWPAMKVLLTSGFPEGLLENGNKLPGGVNLLSKPYRMDDLLRKLREVFDG